MEARGGGGAVATVRLIGADEDGLIWQDTEDETVRYVTALPERRLLVGSGSIPLSEAGELLEVWRWNGAEWVRWY